MNLATMGYLVFPRHCHDVILTIQLQRRKINYRSNSRATLSTCENLGI
jgi:hypothetical protein